MAKKIYRKIYSFSLVNLVFLPFLAGNAAFAADAPIAAAQLQQERSFPTARDGEIIDSEGGGAIPYMPLEIVTERGILYISGGIGAEEEAQIKEQENMFNFRLLITGANGEFISDINVAIKDAKDNLIINIADAGPYVYMKIPPAEYVVEAVGKDGIGKRFTFKLPETGAVKTQLKL